MAKKTAIARLLWSPLTDCMAAVDAVVARRPALTLPLALLAIAPAWILYVPLHELAHAFGCIATGGEVTRLEIDAVYGARWLQRIFPFVTVGSEYAGQLTGFDTGGSDLVYLATDFAPFLLTIFIGVPALRQVARRRRPVSAALLLGAAFPVAYAPFVSLPGDFYEMGSIIVSRLFAGVAGVPEARWRSDDVFLLVDTLRAGDGGGADWLGIGAAALVGFSLALATYAAGVLVAEALERRQDRRRGVSATDTSA